MAQNGIPELNKKEFDKLVDDKGLVVVDFFADWCMPCLIMGPIFEEVSEKFKGKIKFAKVNVDENQDLSAKFKVLSIPTTVTFKDGKEIGRFIGAMSAEDLESRMEGFLKAHKK